MSLRGGLSGIQTSDFQTQSTEFTTEPPRSISNFVKNLLTDYNISRSLDSSQTEFVSLVEWLERT